MLSNQKKNICFLLIFFVTGFIFEFAELWADEDYALKLYHKGISAKTVSKREQFIEKALEAYLGQFYVLKKKGQINGLLCYNIGNCYFNLDQIGNAVYYYKLAQTLLPTNEKIRDNLKIALQQNKNTVFYSRDGVITALLFFHYYLSPARRINILIVFSIVSAFLLILFQYYDKNIIKYMSIISCSIALVLFISIGFGYYMPDHLGVFTCDADVRKDAGLGFAPITTKPLGAGSVVRVLSLNKKWYKIKLNDGQEGHVRQKNLKLIIRY